LLNYKNTKTQPNILAANFPVSDFYISNVAAL